MSPGKNAVRPAGAVNSKATTGAIILTVKVNLPVSVFLTFAFTRKFCASLPEACRTILRFCRRSERPFGFTKEKDDLRQKLDLRLSSAANGEDAVIIYDCMADQTSENISAHGIVDGIQVPRVLHNVCPHSSHQVMQSSRREKLKIVLLPALTTGVFSSSDGICNLHARSYPENVLNFDSDKAQLVPVRLEEM